MKCPNSCTNTIAPSISMKYNKLNKFIKKNRFDKKDILMIGDQELTDVICSKFLKVRIVLTEPLVKTDLPITKVNRFFDKIIRKMIKKKLLKVEVKNEQD